MHRRCSLSGLAVSRWCTIKPLIRKGLSLQVNQIFRFGLFEIDATAGELRKESRPVKLQEQPFQLLLLLVQRAGEVVTREELQRSVWPADTFVDFDHGVNTAVKKIRQALGDSAQNPRFVETLPRKGYRFIAPVSRPEAVAVPAVLPSPPVRWQVPAIGVAALVLAGGLWYAMRSKPVPVAEIAGVPAPFSSEPGLETDANFSPDGRRVAYSWNGPGRDNFDIYVKETGVETPVRLTSDPGRDYGPAFSPDGSGSRFCANGKERGPPSL